MTDLQIAQQQWADTLGQLQSQMARRTFDDWVKDTEIVSTHNGSYTIAAKSTAAKDWLENRLYKTLQRALAAVAGQPDIQLVIIVATDPPAPEEIVGISESEAGFAPEQPGAPLVTQNGAGRGFVLTTDFYHKKMDMGFWLPEFNYDQTFWFRYLKRGAYLLRRGLEMHWLANHAKKEERDLKNSANHWTSPFRVRYREMARWLGLKKVELIKGGEVECHACYLARLKEQPLTTCCGKYPFHDWRKAKDGTARCYHWQPGMVHRLHREGLVAIEIIKPSDHPRAHQAWLQVRRVFPFLTPIQDEALDPITRKEHEVWIRNFGSNFGLTYSQWEEFPEASHVILMPGYQEGKQLQGQPETDPFAPSCPSCNQADEPDSLTCSDISDEVEGEDNQ